MEVIITYIPTLLLILCCIAGTVRGKHDVRCPTSQAEWNKRSQDFGCGSFSQYHCLLTENYSLVELCTRRKGIGYGKCPLLNSEGSITDKTFPCSVDIEGCPNDSAGYHSDKLFKFSDCYIRDTIVMGDKRCWINPKTFNDGEQRSRNEEVTRKTKFFNGTLTEKRNGDNSFFKIKPLHLLIGALVIITILLAIIIMCAVKGCCRRKRPYNAIVDQVGLLSTPLSSRRHQTLYDDIYGIRIAPSMPMLRPAPSRELVYDYPFPENRSFPLLNRSIPAISELPPSRFASREVLASCNNMHASMEPFYIEVVDSLRTGMSASSYLSPRPQRRYDSLDRFQRFRDMTTHRGYRTMHTMRANLALQQRRSSL